MDGIAASSSTPVRSTRATRTGVSSVSPIAAAQPSGVAISSAIAHTAIVPHTMAAAPKSARAGYHTDEVSNRSQSTGPEYTPSTRNATTASTATSVVNPATMASTAGHGIDRGRSMGRCAAAVATDHCSNSATVR
jgi:hypothetical protein